MLLGRADRAKDFIILGRQRGSLLPSLHRLVSVEACCLESQLVVGFAEQVRVLLPCNNFLLCQALRPNLNLLFVPG